MPTLPTLTNVTEPKQSGYDGALGDLLIRLATSPERQLEIVTAPKEAQRIQTAQTSEDYLPEFGQVFSRNDFSGGQGLDFAFKPNLTDLDRTRYWDSNGVDVAPDSPGELARVELLFDTELVSPTWGNGASLSMVRGGADSAFLFVAGDSSTVNRITDPLGSPVVTSEDPHTGTQNVTALAALGSEVYAAVGTDGIGKRSTAGTWSNLGLAPTSVGLFSAKGRLISDNGAGIVSTIATTDGTATTLLTLRPNDTVNGVVDAGPVILISTNDGVIYAVRDNGGTLELVNQTRITPTDDVRCMAWSAGSLIVGTWNGTTGRIWSAQIGTSDQDFTVTGAQLLRELDYEPTAAAAARSAIYVGAQSGALQCELWRYDVATTGISRHYRYTTTVAGTVAEIVVYNGSVLTAIGAATNGVYRPLPTYVTSGYVISPMADFYSPNEKSWVGMTIQADDLTDGAQLELYIATDPDALLDPDSALWLLIGRVTSVGQGELLLPSIKGRYAAFQIKLVANAIATISPALVSVALRAYSDSEDFLVSLPVNISDWIERPNRQPFRVIGWGERVYSALLGFDGEFLTLQIYKPAVTVKGVVEQIGAPVIGRSQRGSTTTYAVIRVRGRLVPSGSASSGTLGVETLGMAQLGV